MRQREIEQARLFRKRPGDEAAAHSRVASRSELASKPGLVPIAATNEPEAASLGDRRSKAAAGDAAHWGEQYRMSDAKLFREACAQGHVTFGMRG